MDSLIETSGASGEHDPHSDSIPSSDLIAFDDTEIVWHADNATQDFFQPAIDSIFAPIFAPLVFTSSLGEASLATDVQAGLPLSSTRVSGNANEQFNQALATSAAQTSTTMPYRQLRKPRP